MLRRVGSVVLGMWSTRILFPGLDLCIEAPATVVVVLT